ncbi:MAG: V-type ATP synthase subunit I [Eubacteriales bacterium]|nr:V-type ATP synthase subunit I [Eubacteriales bacterium]
MAIVEMKKFHLLALKSDKEELLRRLQIFRNVQFNDIASEEHRTETYAALAPVKAVEAYNEADTALTRCEYCLNQLGKYYPEKGGFKALKEGLPNLTFSELEEQAKKVDFQGIYEQIKHNGDALDGARYDLHKAREEINELSVFRKLDIVPRETDGLRKAASYIGSVPIKSRREFEAALNTLERVYFELIGLKKDDAMYVIFFYRPDEAAVDEILKEKGFSKINLKLNQRVEDRLKELKEEIRLLRQRREQTIKELGEMTKYRTALKLYYEYMSNLRVRIDTNRLLLGSDSTCCIEGYFPAYQETEFLQIINEVTGGANNTTVEDVDRDSRDVPIMLKNNKLFGIFEPVTATYAMPRYNELDPTPWLAPFYALFFGMMSADAGYGLLMLVLCALGLKMFNLKPGMKKNVKFFLIVSIFTLFWGVIYNSYFGFKLEFMPQVLDMGTQAMPILLLSVAMGAIHLFTGLALKGYMLIRDGHALDAVFDVLSWYLALIGAILFIGGGPMGLSASVSNVAKWVMIAGMALIVIGGMRSTPGGIGGKIGAGMYNLYGISGYVGDFVSYSRLMALGLSGAYIALSVNTIAGMMFGNVFGIIVGIIIMILFHAFNIFLSYLGAYVHGMRLIYVEFFGKFYEGGGKPFRYFRSKSKYINLDRQLEE